MSGSLIKLDEEIVSSSVASVQLGASNWDSSYDVYVVKISDLHMDASASVYARVLVSGTADTSANYCSSGKNLRADQAFDNQAETNATQINEIILSSDDGVTGSAGNGIHYLFSFNNASEFSYISFENTTVRANSKLMGKQGSAVSKVTQACNGIEYTGNGQNITGGRFSLYALHK